jgi:hypothetical protein
MCQGLTRSFEYGMLDCVAVAEGRLDVLLWLYDVESHTVTDPLTLMSLAVQAETENKPDTADWLMLQTDLDAHRLDNLVPYALLSGNLPLAKLLQRIGLIELSERDLQAAIASRSIECIKYVDEHIRGSYDTDCHRAQTAAYIGDISVWEYCMEDTVWDIGMSLDAFRIAARYGNIEILQDMRGSDPYWGHSIEEAGHHPDTVRWLTKIGLLE